MAAPPTIRETYLRRAGRFCRDTFGSGFAFVPCGRAFAEATSEDDAARNLLCVALAKTPEELAECIELSKGLTFGEMSAAESVVRKRFGGEAVDGGRVLVGRATDILKDFVGPEGRVISPAFPPGPAPPTPAPAAAPVPARRVVTVAEFCADLTDILPRLEKLTGVPEAEYMQRLADCFTSSLGPIGARRR